MPLTTGTTISQRSNRMDGLAHHQPNSLRFVTVQANEANPTLEAGTVLGKVTDGNWTIYDPAAADGSETSAHGSAGILLNRVTSLTGESAQILFQRGVYTRSMLQWGDGIDSTEQDAAVAILEAPDIRIECR